MTIVEARALQTRDMIRHMPSGLVYRFTASDEQGGWVTGIRQNDQEQWVYRDAPAEQWEKAAREAPAARKPLRGEHG